LRLAKQVLILGLAGFAVFFFFKVQAGHWGLEDRTRYAVEDLARSYIRLSQVALWFGGFIVLYSATKARSLLRLLAPYGRMSLTGYVTQSLIGVPLFYGYGLALYRYLGPFYSVLCGVAVFVVQCACAHLWLKRFYYGPLEWLWRSATMLPSAVPMRKPPGR
jgi:uncharacterized protein